jgi:hypothetical protein
MTAREKKMEPAKKEEMANGEPVSDPIAALLPTESPGPKFWLL